MQRILHALVGVMSAALLVVPAGCGGSAQPFVGPPPKVSPSMASISFGSSTPCAQIPCTTTFSVSESGYSGTFTATSSNTSVATVASSTSPSQARKAQDTTATFVVTAVSGGTATITVSDQNGHSASIPVSVSSITFTPQLQR